MSHTPTPWKVVSAPHFDSGLTYTSVQPVTPNPETMRPLRMASGEYHVCRMTHTAARHAIDMHQANADLIVKAVNSHDALVEALTACASIMPRYRMAGQTTGDDEELDAVLERVTEALEEAK